MSARMERMIARVIGGGSVRRRRPNPVVAIWRWRYEVVLLVALVAWLWAGAEYGTPVGIGSVAVALVAVAVLAVWPAARRFVAGRYWAVVVAHRLRTGFHESGLAGLSGRLPAILWATPRGSAVRVLVALPAGVDITELTAARNFLATATFASDVLVERHPRFAHVVRLVVVRRPSTGAGAP